MEMIKRFIEWLKRLLGCGDTAPHTVDLELGMNVVVYQGDKLSAEVVMRPLVRKGALQVMRLQRVDGVIVEYYFSRFPASRWVNEIGVMRKGETYYIKVSKPYKGLEF